MRLTNRLALAALAGIVGLGGLMAAPAVARTSVSIEYRDRDYRDRDWRHDRRDDRRWSDNRRWDRRYYGYNDYRRHCWTEWRYDRRHGRYPVRFCR